jgi:ADP-heptose:LPS heptosyltransferase
MKILLIRRDNIGDMICTLPLISALSNLGEHTEIDVLTNSYVSPILSKIAHIRRVFHYQKLKHGGPNKLRICIQSVRSYFSVRAVFYDYIICFSSRDLALSLLLRGKNRITYVKAARGLIGSFGVTKVPWHAESHEVIRAWSLGGPLGLNVDSPPMKTPQLAPFYPKASSSTLSDRIAIQLSARKIGQRWPTEKYLELISRLSASGYALSVLWAPGSGSNRFHPGDDDKARYLASRINSPKVNFVRTLELASLVAELQRCQFMISPDGGAAHIAAALDLRSVILFGNSDPAHWAPWNDGNIILTGAAGRVDTISVESVLRGFEAVSGGVISLRGSLQSTVS